MGHDNNILGDDRNKDDVGDDINESKNTAALVSFTSSLPRSAFRFGVCCCDHKNKNGWMAFPMSWPTNQKRAVGWTFGFPLFVFFQMFSSLPSTSSSSQPLRWRDHTRRFRADTGRRSSKKELGCVSAPQRIGID